ncbi:MAG TPA: MarR family transcriptional regulator [Chitinophagaceae bacterium]|nr:MarR family transcriptional regulator [Chitinophagaceae bacterium]
MSLEKDISQRKFKTEHQKAMVNLIFTHNWMMERMKLFFEQADLTPQQFNIMRILRGAGQPLSTLQIRQRMLDKMSDTSRIVDRLIKKGLAKKVICKSDRRLVDVSISEKGLKLLEKLDDTQADLDAILTNLNETDAKQLNKLLDKIRNSE